MQELLQVFNWTQWGTWFSIETGYYRLSCDIGPVKSAAADDGSAEAHADSTRKHFLNFQSVHTFPQHNNNINNNNKIELRLSRQPLTFSSSKSLGDLKSYIIEDNKFANPG